MKKSALLEEKHHAGNAENQHSGQKDSKGCLFLAGPGFDVHNMAPCLCQNLISQYVSVTSRDISRALALGLWPSQIFKKYKFLG